MSLNDFDRLTPDEFAAIVASYKKTNIQEPWDRARFVACSVLQPWSKKALRMTDICKFDWDETADRRPQNATPSTRERFNEICKRV